MRIVIDENVLLAREPFARLGECIIVPPAAITPSMLRHADALIVRSTVRVDRALLVGSPVKFVGTATSGTDHVDERALHDAGIAFASAAGANAAAVAEYVVAALLSVAGNLRIELAGRTLGVVGVGHVGRRVVDRGNALGLRVLQCDPPRARSESAGRFVDLAVLLRESDVVTLHVPLSHDGPDATRGMIDAPALDRMKRGAVFLNTARGGVVDTQAVVAARRSGQLAALVVDVWDAEPRPDPDLFETADLLTPHVAGYSRESLVRATWCAAEALARFSGREPDSLPAAPATGPLEIECADLIDDDRSQPTVADIVRRVFDIAEFSRAYRQQVRADGNSDPRKIFTEFRTRAGLRREFGTVRLRRSFPTDSPLGVLLSRLGLEISGR